MGLTVIIGAGFAGLSAATRLAAAGRRVLVLEARPRLGGRATSLVDRETGHTVDNGQHVMFGCYAETLGWLRSIGAEANVRAQLSLDVRYVDWRGRSSRLRCPDLPGPLHLLGGLIEWRALDWRDRFAAVRVFRAVKRLQGSGFRVQDGGSVEEWLVQLRQTERLRQFLWEPLAVAALNEPVHEASASAFAEVLSLMFSDGPRNAAVVMPAVPLEAMYAAPASAFIAARDGEVRTGALAKVIVEAGRVRGVRVGADTIAAGTVISSVPWNTFATLFDGVAPPQVSDAARAASRMRSRPIVTVNLWYDRPVLDAPFVGLPGATIQWVFAKGPASPSQLSLIVSGAIDLVDRPAEEILAMAVSDLESRLPRARAARRLHGTVVRERHATFATMHPDVTRPSTRTGVEGLFLAGDWIDTGMPGTIEGAVKSGRLAAEAVLGDQ